jgi:hypothetical protein
MTNVVQQNGDLDGLGFPFVDLDALALKGGDSLAHQVQGPQGVVKTSMERTGVNVVRQADLLDASQPLKVRMLHQVKQDTIRNTDETINRIIEDLVGLFHGAKTTEMAMVFWWAVLLALFNLLCILRPRKKW